MKNLPTETKRFVCPCPVKSVTVMLFPPPLEVVTVRVTTVVGAKPPPAAITVIG